MNGRSWCNGIGSEGGKADQMITHHSAGSHSLFTMLPLSMQDPLFVMIKHIHRISSHLQSCGWGTRW